MTMSDWANELNHFLLMNRKDILKDSGNISYKVALEHVKKEYDKYKERVINAPSEVELHYLKIIKELELLDGGKND